MKFQFISEPHDLARNYLSAKLSPIPWKRKYLVAAILVNIVTLIFLGNSSKAREQNSVKSVVDFIAPILVGVGEDLSKDTGIPPPQILFGIGGTNAYGGCIDSSGGSMIPGSYYCPRTNTIILEIFQLEELRKKFGDGSIAYALYHEYAHYIQRAFKLSFSSSLDQELSADCLAGWQLNVTAQKLGLDQSDVQEIYATAYSIGSDTHGQPAQRLGAISYALEKGEIDGCLAFAKGKNIPNRISPDPSFTPHSSNTSSSQPAHKTPTTKAQSENFIGSYNLWGNSLIPISLASSKVGSHFGLKTLAIKYQNDVTDKFHTTQIYVDCSTAKFSLFPDLPSGPRSVQGDTKLLVAARC